MTGPPTCVGRDRQAIDLRALPLFPLKRRKIPGEQETRDDGGDALRRYRYRTSVLTGPWRASQLEAARDAVRANQAVDDITEANGLRWTVPGRIEERFTEEAPTRLRN